MAGKKKAAGKSTTVRGHTYVITPKGEKALVEMSPSQGQQVLKAVASLKTTQAGLLAKIGKKLNAPNPAKTIGFHLSVMKSIGLVKFGPKPKA